jgi:hypothetical protein
MNCRTCDKPCGDLFTCTDCWEVERRLDDYVRSPKGRARVAEALRNATQDQVLRFICPVCQAQHDRGFVNGVDVYRCLRCGYTGTDNEARRE